MKIPTGHGILKSKYSGRIVEAEQLKLLFSILPSSIAVNIIVGGMFAWLMQDVSGAEIASFWFIILSTVMIVRGIIWFIHKNYTGYPRSWFFIFRITVSFSGFAWALASFMLFPENNVPYQAFIAFALAGMTAGSIASLAVDMASILLFLVPSLAALAFKFFQVDTRISWVMGLMVLFFLLFSMIIARRLNRSFIDNINLRLALHEREEDLQESAARLNEAQRMSHVGSYDYNPESGELLWSDEHFRLWGYEPGSIRPGYEVFKSRILPADLPGLEAGLQKALSGGRFFNYFHRVILPDTTIRHIHSRGEVFFDKDNKAIKMVGTAEDVTERIAAEEQLVRARDEADNANKAKSDFLSSMSHEIRTPMNAILGFVQLLNVDDELTNEQKEFVTEIYRAGNHLLDLVNDVLDLAKIEANNIEYKTEVVEIDLLFEECLKLIYGMAQKYQVKITGYLPTGYSVMADRLRLKQVLLNLLSNAVKYNRPGGKVEILVIRESGKIKIRISDTGKGIPEKKLAYLFEPFHRLGAEKSSIEGTGIGLVISRNIVEKMNGNLEVESKEGVGSSFYVSLPIAV